MEKRWATLLTVLLVAVLLVSACAAAEPAPEEPTPVAPVEEPTPLETPDETPMVNETPDGTPTPDDEVVDNGELAGQTVSVIAVWGGAELESFRAMVAPWEERTGATMQYEGTRDLNAVLITRIEGGNPPDIAGVPGPGQLVEFAREGQMVPLSEFMDVDELGELYDESWLELASYEDELYGIFMKATVKSLVWYRPDVFEEAGYEVPETWDELIALSDQIVADGGTPWCIGLESGAASGWPATDWIEDIMLRTAGPDVYDQWWQHEIAWTDEAVQNAWEMFGTIATNEQYVEGGTVGVLATNFGESPYPMFDDPPGCYMHRQASFITDFIQEQFPDLEPGEDYTFFPFPEIEPEYGVPALSAGDLMGMFNDTPAARSLMEWLASAEAQEIWAERGGFLSANREVSPDVYPDVIHRQMAEILQEAEVVRFDASDLMPIAVNDAFWGGALQFIQNPDNLPTILENIEQTAQEAYPNDQTGP
jgi:alpha-glucoside transport system substrate-binding protein